MIPYVLKVEGGVEEAYSFGADRNYIQLDESATVAVTIKSPDTGEQTTLKSGDYAILSPFDELRFSHDGSVDTSFTVFVGKDTRRGGSRVGGSVQVTGGSDNIASPPRIIPLDQRASIDGKHFMFDGAMAGTEFTLSNPAASGVNILIRSITTYSASDTDMSIGVSDIVAVDIASVLFSNKLLSGAAATVLSAMHNLTSAITLSNYVNYDVLAINGVVDLIVGEPIILPPGIILGMTGGAIAATKIFYEEVAA